MKQDYYLFPAVFDFADDGITITFPDLPGCISCADDEKEALYMAKDALRGHLLVMEEGGDEIPAPSPLHSIQTEPNQYAVPIDVNLALYRGGFQSRSVKKTLTIPAWLNEEAERRHLNFSGVLQEALIHKIEADS